MTDQPKNKFEKEMLELNEEFLNILAKIMELV